MGNGTPFGVELPETLTAESAPEEESVETTEETEESGREPKSLGEEEKPETRERQRSDSEPEKASKYLDLDKLERFRFSGKEWRPKDLQKAILRHQDYTQKTQELSAQQKEVAESHKFATNFDIDLAKVLETPALLEQMKQIYPPSYVRVAEKLLQMTPKQQAEVAAGVKPQGQLDPQTRQEIEELKAWRQSQQTRERETEITQIQASLDAKFEKLSTKYPDADAEVINNRALALVQRTGKAVTDSQFEALFKQHHEQMGQRYTARQKAKVEEQRKVNARARDTGPGGGTPGKSPGKMPLKKVKDQIQADIDSGRLS